MTIITLGIDLAKHVFALHGVDVQGHTVLRKPRVSRDQLLSVVANLPPCLIGMEACSGAHHWARLFSQHGHSVKLMAPKFVTPYRMSGKPGKNDAADAAAICEAVTRPNMRFVPIKDTHQQNVLCLHRIRQGFIEERTATYNRLRGLIAEFGIVLPQSVERLRHGMGEHLDQLPTMVKPCVIDLLQHADTLSVQIDDAKHIQQAAKQDARSKQLMQLPGIGPTTASALVASIGNGQLSCSLISACLLFFLDTHLHRLHHLLNSHPFHLYHIKNNLFFGYFFDAEKFSWYFIFYFMLEKSIKFYFMRDSICLF